MRPRFCCGRLGIGRWLAAAAALLLWGGGLRASAAELANRFAPGALGYAEAASLGDIASRVRQSTYWAALAESPQWKQAAATPELRKALAARELVERQLGMDLQAAVTRLLGNRAAVAVYPPSQGTQPDFVLVIQAADDDVVAAVRERLDPLLVLAEDQLRLSQGLDGWERLSADGKLFVAWKGRWIVASSRGERLDEAVARVAGTNADTLAADANFQAMLRTVGEPAAPGARPLLVFVDSDRVRKLVGDKLPEKLDNPAASLLFGDAVARAGRSKFAALTVDLRDRGASARLTLGGESAALAKAFEAFAPQHGESGVRPLPAAAGRIGGWSIYRDFAAWYDARAQLMQEQVLPGFDKFESDLANLLPNRDFGTDVLPLFGKRLTFVSAPQTYDHLGGEPGVKLPGFALVIEMAQPEEAANLLQLFYQTLTTLLSISAGQQGGQPWVMDTDVYRDVPISYAKYLKKPTGDRLGVVFNFLPSSARVGDRFVFSSSLGLCKQLIDDLQQPQTAPAEPSRTAQVELQIDPLADVIEANREFFVGRMVQEGRTAPAAEQEFAALLGLLRQFNSVQLHTEAQPEAYRVELEGTWK